MARNDILKHKVLNGWGLFTLASIPICVFVIVEAASIDLQTGAGISHMIGYSVRWAIPFIYLVVAASSFHVLFPGTLSKW